jgi:hypothetical protein
MPPDRLRLDFADPADPTSYLRVGETARDAHKGGWIGAFELLVEYATTP